MRVDKPMLNPDGTECCGNDAHDSEEVLIAQLEDLKNRNQLLRLRPDLPAERLQAHDALTARIKELEPAELMAQTVLSYVRLLLEHLAEAAGIPLETDEDASKNNDTLEREIAAELARTRTLTTAGQALADLAGENWRQQTASNSEAADLEDFEGWLDGFLLREATALATWEQALQPDPRLFRRATPVKFQVITEWTPAYPDEPPTREACDSLREARYLGRSHSCTTGARTILVVQLGEWGQQVTHSSWSHLNSHWCDCSVDAVVLANTTDSVDFADPPEERAMDHLREAGLL